MGRWRGLVVGLVVGCGPVVGTIDDGESSTGASDPSTTRGDGSSTFPGTTATTTSAGTSVGTSVGTTDAGTSVDDSADDVDDSGCSFIPEGCWDYGGNTAIECDVWTQDCPEGDKCMPWANDGGPYWNATRCAPIDALAVDVGEPCIVEGSYTSGIDNCRLGAQCLWVDPETNTGVCAENCSGSEADPLCPDPATTCTITFEGVIHLCLPTCDPLAQDCMPNATCVPTGDGSRFVCASMLAPLLFEHDTCASPWDCAPGLDCASGELDPGCAGDLCCAQYCDLMLGDAYCEGGQTCAPWYGRGQAPPGLEDVGLCVN